MYFVLHEMKKLLKKFSLTVLLIIVTYKFVLYWVIGKFFFSKRGKTLLSLSLKKTTKLFKANIFK